jgi:predicted RNA-binding Zn-ribbon protein involved in translation (DUF1610 family)
VAVDPLFPYPEFPPPSDAPTGQLDRSRVRYPRGMFGQLAYRPFNPVTRKPVVQPLPPRPKTVAVTDCPQCEARGVRSQMTWFPPGFYDCRKCGFRYRPK